MLGASGSGEAEHAASIFGGAEEKLGEGDAEGVADAGHLVDVDAAGEVLDLGDGGGVDVEAFGELGLGESGTDAFGADGACYRQGEGVIRHVPDDRPAWARSPHQVSSGNRNPLLGLDNLVEQL